MKEAQSNRDYQGQIGQINSEYEGQEQESDLPDILAGDIELNQMDENILTTDNDLFEF
jgi:hypothetical protein